MERILVRRTGAFGDVIDTTPVIRRLRQENPDAEIDVLTQYPGVYKHSLHRVGVKRDVRYDRSHTLPVASTFFSCLRGDNKCVTMFDSETIADQVESAARETASA